MKSNFYEKYDQFPGRYCCGTDGEDKLCSENILFCSGAVISVVSFKSEKDKEKKAVKIHEDQKLKKVL